MIWPNDHDEEEESGVHDRAGKMVTKVLCVAEKPSIAKAVANHLSGNQVTPVSLPFQNGTFAMALTLCPA